MVLYICSRISNIAVDIARILNYDCNIYIYILKSTFPEIWFLLSRFVFKRWWPSFRPPLALPLADEEMIDWSVLKKVTTLIVMMAEIHSEAFAVWEMYISCYYKHLLHLWQQYYHCLSGWPILTPSRYKVNRAASWGYVAAHHIDVNITIQFGFFVL